MLTLVSMLNRTVGCFGHRSAIVDPERGYSWSEFAERVARAAGVLQLLGLRRGDRYAIICQNSFRNCELMHAGYWMGAIPAPVNFRLAPPEIAYILDNSQCRLVIVDSAFAGLLGADEISGLADNVLIVSGPGSDGQPHDGGPHHDAPRYDAMLEQAEPIAPFDGAGEDDEALLLYTGGTTGRAKGVPLSHRNIVTNAMQIALAAAPRPDDVFLHVAPMFHSADLLANPFTLAGAAHLYLPKFTSKAALEAIERFGVTTTLLTPTMITMMLQDPDLGRHDIATLRQVIYGSSPMAAEWIGKALRAFGGVEFIQAYGLTETSPILTTLSMADHQQAIASGDEALLRSVGQPVVGVDLKLVDPHGEAVANGEAGEVVVRGPNVARSYLKRPEASAESFRDGWFFTGDIARLDDEGHLFLLDRKKDMIITGGEIVYSLEVEAALHRHREVDDCAVIAVPDEVYGEALLAVVVPAPGAVLSPDELIAHCRGRIGGYKIPRRFVFLDELPRSAMNKVLKNELRRIYAEQSHSQSQSQSRA